MKLDIAKGMRDFGPKEQLLRNQIIKTIRATYERYGFAPLETPIVERFDVMTAKFAAGEEADIAKEIFQVTDQGKRKLGLRYEFTFPLARYIAMNPTIKQPFKRYAIGPVFRDGPIKAGRYREFYQCDVDIVGTTSLLADAECAAAAYEALTTLGLKPVVKISSRKLLFELLDKAGIKTKLQTSTVISIDKLEKIGAKGVTEELTNKGIDKAACKKILTLIGAEGTDANKLNFYKEELGESPAYKELAELFSWLKLLNVPFQFTPSLARGLGYYTGPIFEFFVEGDEVTSSIAAGGRYDNLIGEYLGSKEPFPATGVSIGLEPVFEILRRKAKAITSPAQLYIIPLGTLTESVTLTQALRASGISTMIDLKSKNLKKNLDYASQLGIPFVAIVGENEVKAGKLTLKDMETGKQETLSVKEIVKRVQEK